MQMIDALMSQFASNSQINKWGLLHKKIRKHSKNRNIAAHGHFVFFGQHPKRKAVIGRSVYDITKFPDKPNLQDFAKSSELQEHAVKFILLAKEVDEFLAELRRDQRGWLIRPKRFFPPRACRPVA